MGVQLIKSNHSQGGLDMVVDVLGIVQDRVRSYASQVGFQPNIQPFAYSHFIAIIKKLNNRQKRRTNGSSPGEKPKRELSGWPPGGDSNCGFSNSAGWLSSWTTFSQ